METTSLSNNDLLGKLRQALSGKKDSVPPGFKSCHQWAAEWGISGAHTRRLIKAGIDNGTLERKDLRIRSDAGIHVVPHYREKNGTQ